MTLNFCLEILDIDEIEQESIYKEKLNGLMERLRSIYPEKEDSNSSAVFGIFFFYYRNFDFDNVRPNMPKQYRILYKGLEY